MADSSDALHLPRSAPIEAYGKGGFAFADMSHRGSLLCLPDGIWAWPVSKPSEIDEYSLARVFKAANSIDTLIVGTGTDVWIPPRGLREATKDSAGFCADLVRTHDFVRFASTLFMPAAQRRALLAIYAFNVEISRVRDHVSQPLPGEMRLQWWTDMLAGAGHGGIEGNPVAAELQLAIQNWYLPVERLSRLIDEHQFDLYNDPMPTMAALESYINDTSSALFSLGAGIAGAQSDRIEHLARHAGLAQGMAQLMAALPRDASRRQLFVPLQVLQQHGSGMEEVFAGKQTAKLRAV